MNRYLFTLGLLLISAGGPCCLPDAARATIYSFTDEKGVVHFTNVPDNPKYKPVFAERTFIPPSPPPLTTNTSKVAAAYGGFIHQAASAYAVDPALIKAVIKTESDFDRYAVSPKGAKGLMQLMPDTAKDMAVSDLFDPVANINGGTRYLRKLLKLFDGDLQLSLASYNAGPTLVKSYGRVPDILETTNYVKTVLKHYQRYQKDTAAVY